MIDARTTPWERKSWTAQVIAFVGILWAIGALLFVAVALSGCDQAPVSTAKTNNPNISVDLLLTQDGCRVYRFVDGITNRYFVTCPSGNAAAISEHTTYCGKGCYRHHDDTIFTGRSSP